jgi:hypothetical protein
MIDKLLTISFPEPTSVFLLFSSNIARICALTLPNMTIGGMLQEGKRDFTPYCRIYVSKKC